MDSHRAIFNLIKVELDKQKKKSELSTLVHGIANAEDIDTLLSLCEFIKVMAYADKPVNMDAKCVFAICCILGLGTEVDHKEAAKLFTEASNKKNIAGIYGLSYCFREGLGVEKDFKKGMKLLEEAANKNSSFALFDLFKEKEKVNPDPSHKLLKKAIKYKNTDAQVYLAMFQKRQLDHDWSLLKRHFNIPINRLRNVKLDSKELSESWKKMVDEHNAMLKEKSEKTKNEKMAKVEKFAEKIFKEKLDEIIESLESCARLGDPTAVEELAKIHKSESVVNLIHASVDGFFTLVKSEFNVSLRNLVADYAADARALEYKLR